MSQILTSGELVIRGKSPEGEDVEFRADIEKFKLDTQYPNQIWNNYSINTNSFIAPTPRITLSMEVKRNSKGSLYTVSKITPKGVERTARVEVLFVPEAVESRDVTVQEVCDAADTAGVDRTTPFSLIYENSLTRKGTVIFAEFKWTE